MTTAQYLEKIEQLEQKLAESRARESRLAECIGKLQRRIHMSDRHNQHFERCESGWCNPSRTRTLALCDDPAGVYAARHTDSLRWLEAQRKRAAADEINEWATAFRKAGHDDDAYNFENRAVKLHTEADALECD